MDRTVLEQQSDSLKLNYQRISAELGLRSTDVRTQAAAWNITAEQIRKSLPRDAVVLDYYCFRVSDTLPPAIALIAVDADSTRLTWLAPPQTIDSSIAAYRAHMQRMSAQRYLPTFQDVTEYRKLASSLYLLLVEPVSGLLKRKQAIYVSPSGGINSLSFAGLCGPDGRYLAESYEIQYLDATRELVIHTDSGNPGNGALGLGDPDYDGTGTDSSNSASTTPTSESSSVARFTLRGGCKQYLDSLFEELPGTRREIDAVRSSWAASKTPSQIFVGEDASEENFKRFAPGHRLLHLATHGFYLRGECNTADSDVNSPVSSPPSNHPLLTSGLLLANARYAISHPERIQGEDGILSALEVAEMDLSGVEVVTLSACETGLGIEQGTEGVFGLRRAFAMAGASEVLSSLWEIPDEATTTLMSEIYESSGSSVARAVSDAQLHYLKSLRDAGLADHPFLWAAFVPYGSLNR
jgi:CHAT domain-containing protein